MIITKAWAVWKGGIKDGGGTISTETGVLKDAHSVHETEINTSIQDRGHARR